MSVTVSWETPEPAPALEKPRTATRRLTPELLERWRTSLKNWDAPPAAHNALDLLQNPQTPVVVTGQQPGPWGGPLYSVYKTATAMALARRLGREAGVPGVAVFWMGADDTDFDEVGWGCLPAADGSLYRHRWNNPGESRSWLGDAVLGNPEEASALLPEGMVTGDLDLGDQFARRLLATFGMHGLLVLDARWPEVRAAGESLYRDYVERHEEVTKAIRIMGERTAGKDGKPAIDPEAASQGLYVLDGHRRLAPDPDWTRTARDLLDQGQAHRLAPSVVLRAPLQDHLLEPEVQVVGRGEQAYLAELRPIYGKLGVHEPVRMPRLHATVLPQGLLPRDMFPMATEDPESYIASLVAAEMENATADRIRKLREQVGQDLEQLGSEAGGEMAESASSAGRKIDQQFGRLTEALERRARRAVYRDNPGLRHFSEFVRPRRAPQDRGISAAALPALFGKGFAARVLRTADLHLDRAEDGAVHHFVLEAVHD